MGRTGWINVDLDGLRKLMERRGKEFIIYELVQNAWDEKVTRVDVTLTRPQRGRSHLTVVDDSVKGFGNLADAYTLFAESYKKANPERRGAFNAGDKFVLALCQAARIQTTGGTIFFDDAGRRKSRHRRDIGSEFSAVVELTLEEWARICAAARRLIPPVKTTFNGEEIGQRVPIHEFAAAIPTLAADADGRLCRKIRETTVRLFEPKPDEKATLYEMGIPVVETEDRWHVDVQQKVPLNMERDNVTPAYLRTVRVAVFNAMAAHLSNQDATATWVREAMSDERSAREATAKVMNLRFGNKRVTYDPSDPEANMIAVSHGYTVVSPGSLSGAEWKQVKAHNLLVAAGQVTPSPKPFSEGGRPLKVLEPDELSRDMLEFEAFANMVGRLILGHEVQIKFANDPRWHFGGCYGAGALTVNVGRMGWKWFEGAWGERVYQWTKFLFHEFAHETVSNHLSEDFHKACCHLGATFARRIVENPQLFQAPCANPGRPTS